MDIPNTGAIFTLGKSHLAENTQSYFYIKNDPIKRLVAGPSQSAVICESGRLFVWGENHHGQLGIGGNHSTNNNNNGDIIIKPTCVKSLKALGLKIADVSFGSNWSIILTISNELFFAGRNIFASDCSVSKHFTEATVNGELCDMTRKPFRLEEFDDCLSNNEEAENFVNVLAGNEHFVLLTSFGRLIGWGSNQFHQLGTSNDNAILKPHEIILDSPIQQYTCGPESTLILTKNGKLYLTGRLNEFLFPDFTELQKNLSSNEQITFLNISKASEIFIVTNTGSIYRSYESVRNKSLIFQRFYDYDSEENGPIWKLLKGTSFYTVLTRANKFYTTFSESGHHLKTFREISKFKNLRILDMALGDKHILVHGIPRSSTLAATLGPGIEYRHMTQSMILANATGGIEERIENNNSMVVNDTQTSTENVNIEERLEEKPNTNTLENVQGDIKLGANSDNKKFSDGYEMELEALDFAQNGNVKESEESIESFETGNTVVNNRSPAHSMASRNSSASSLKNDIETTSVGVKSLRPRTPFPESSPRGSPPSIMKRTPIRNLSYETAISNDFIPHASPALVESLENIPELVTQENANLPGLTVSMPTPPTELDEELTLEISEITDPLDHTVTVNEIRFINNGIDVTANVKQFKSDGSENSLDITEDDEENEKHKVSEENVEIRKEAENFIEELEEEIERNVEIAKVNKLEKEHALKSGYNPLEDNVDSNFSATRDFIDNTANEASGSVDSRLEETKGSLELLATRAATGAREAVRNLSDNTKNAAKSAQQSLEDVGNSISTTSDDAVTAVSHMDEKVSKTTGDAKEAMQNTLRKLAGDTKQAVGTVTSKISNEVQDAKNSLSSMLQGKKNKVDVLRPIEQEDDFQSEATSKESGEHKSNTTTRSNNTTGRQEDDERTTVSANSNHSALGGNPFESTDPFDPELDAMVQRGKQALREELQAASVAVGKKPERVIHDVKEEKSTFTRFLEDLKEKSKGLSCRSDKSINIVEDQPPRYSVEDELSVQPVNSNANSSRVCTIL